MRTSAFLVAVAFLLAGCGDPTTVIDRAADRLQRVADRVASIADSHESLYSAMLRCDENLCDILDSVTDVPSAQAASPRMESEIKRYRGLAQRFLALGAPSDDEWKRIANQYADRERAIVARRAEFMKRMTADQQAIVRELTVPMVELGLAQIDFSSKLQALIRAKATGIDVTPSAEDRAQIAQGERAAAAAASALEKLTELLRAVQDQTSGNERREAMRTEVEKLRKAIDELTGLPVRKKIQGTIALGPAEQRLGEAYRNYFTLSNEKLGNSRRGSFVSKEDFDANWIMMNRNHRDSEKAFASADRLAANLPGRGPAVNPFDAPRAGSTKAANSNEWRLQKPPTPAPIPFDPPPGGPASVTILISDLPAGTFQAVTSRLKSICNSKNNQARSHNGQYTFQFETAEDLQRLAERIEFAAVTKVDQQARTITIKIDPTRLPKGS